MFHLPLQITLPAFLQALCSLICMASISPPPFCWIQPIWGLAKRSEGWGHDAYFPSSFLYSLVVFLLKTTAPIRQPYVQLEVPLQFVTFWFCPLDPSSLGWYGPSRAKHEVLHHPLLVSLNPTYTFRNDATLLLNSPQLSHVVEKAMRVLLRPRATLPLM